MLLLPLLLFVVFALIAVSSMRRAGRRRFEYEEQLAREAAERGPSRGGDDGYSGSSFGASPFGGLLESLMTGAGARSYAYEPVTGRWVEVSQEEPPPPADDNGQAPKQEARAQRRRRRQPAQQNPLGSLFGGGMMGGDAAASSRCSRPRS